MTSQPRWQQCLAGAAVKTTEEEAVAEAGATTVSPPTMGLVNSPVASSQVKIGVQDTRTTPQKAAAEPIGGGVMEHIIVVTELHALGRTG